MDQYQHKVYMAFVDTESTWDEKASKHRFYFNKNHEAKFYYSDLEQHDHYGQCYLAWVQFFMFSRIISHNEASSILVSF
jgi:hypothetical protein